MNKNLLVLISSLNADVKALIPKFNLKTDCVIVNQGDIDDCYEYIYNGHKVFVIESTTRGLSKSRNIAKDKALDLNYDIILFADDDVEYCNTYLDTIYRSYENNKDADIIAFDILRLNYLGNTENNDKDCPPPNYFVTKSTRKHEYFGSVRISIKTDFLNKNKIRFNEIFGAGSKQYTHGEDSLFLRDCKDHGAKVYKSKDIIAKVDFSESTWRNVPFSKICFDKGALWRELSPQLFRVYGLLLIYRMSREENEKFLPNYKYYLNGAKDYRNLL